jgi:hypothetical protein
LPAGGGSVANLEVITDNAPTGAQTYVGTVVDNTTGSTVLSCTITAGNSFCQNTGSVAVAAGHYLEVVITNTGGASNANWRVSFRY